MTFADWLALASICTLGAASPGPSLAVVLRSTMTGGHVAGMVTAVAHGAGIGVYALLVAAGLGVLVTQSPAIYLALTIGGAVFLVWLGSNAIRHAGRAMAASGPSTTAATHKLTTAARDGFLIAFLNPKIAVWFLALFSQFVTPTMAWPTKLGMASLAAGIDTIWYLLVATLLSQANVLDRIRRNAKWIDRLFGALLIGIAMRVLWTVATQ